jgi:hypothetical protein
VDLVAHRGNVGLVKEELGSVAPAIAVLGLLLREGQHVVGCIANSAQDGPVLYREGLGQFLGEVRTRQRHAPYLGGLGREASLPRIRVCSGGHHLLGIRGPAQRKIDLLDGATMLMEHDVRPERHHGEPRLDALDLVNQKLA